MFSKLKKEIDSLSPWFKIVLIVMAFIYLGLWFYTIKLSSNQTVKNFEPVLPTAPKDSHEYVLLSQSLMRGDGLSSNGRIETLRMPGYPLFVGILKTVGRSYFVVTFVQILLVFVTILILRRIGIVFSGNKVGEISATLLLVNPVTMTLSLLILTDVLFIFLFTLGFYLAITINERKPFIKVIMVSLIFISAIYVRGMGLFALPIFMLPILVTKLPFKLQAKLLGVMFFMILLSIVPWIARNSVQTGIRSFNTFEAENLSFAIPKFLSYKNGTKEEEEIANFLKVAGVPNYIWQDYGGRNINYAKQISKAGEKIILDMPFSYLKFHLTSSIPFLFPSSILFMRDAYDSAVDQKREFQYGAINALISGDWGTFYKSIKEVWWKFAERILWLFAYFVSLFGIWKNRQSRLTWVFIFIFAYLMVLSGPAAGPRLSFQAWPYMFLLFAEGGVYLYQRFLLGKNPNSFNLQ
ncbi:MAG: hypothetical protein CEO12_204 [Parcubacteria group bacterium Gr01-1014_46]|nr:MAG: hypothetical protein CEO12_204 [Parcubacteria group bacterium Gr01-1014_46]